jgi:hypothetical protein
VAFCGLVVVLVASLALVALVRRSPAVPPDHAVRWPIALAPADAHRALAGLPVVELAHEVAYDRTTDFGPAWADVDHNGCGTRDDVLRRDLTALRARPGTHGCVIVAGLLDDPYTGARLAFSKSRADAVQIDHLIPLHAAWMLGAWQWTPERRLAYANDPRVLVAVDGAANQDKGDALADRWRPPNRRSWCAYAVNTVAIHVEYGLGVTAPERTALEGMLERCA